MRKKRKMTKTTMVKKLFLFLAITAGLLTSCKDYDDDIDGLNEDIAALQTALGTANTDLSTLKTQIQAAATDNEVTAAVNAAKTEAVNQAKTQTEALIDALKGGSTKTIKALETDLTALTASLQALQVQVGTLATAAQLDAAKLDIAANKAAIALQQAVLDKYLLVSGTDNVVDKIAAIKTELAALQASTTTDHAAMQAAIDAIEAKIVAIDAKLNVLNFAAVNSMVTEITFVYSPLTNILLTQSLDYSTAIAKTSDWFGNSSWASAIKFTAGQRFLADESSIIVKVEPANADLSTMLDKIYLLRSDENNEINKYIKAVKATRYTGLLTRGATTPTGLWEITFELPATSDLSAVAGLARSNGRPVLFAVAIESSVVEDESRFVVSEFGASISVGDKDPVYNDDDFRSTIGRENDLTFSVKLETEDENQYINYRNIRNRYAESETQSIVPKDQKWEPGHWTATAGQEDDPADNRLGKDLFAVEANTVFNVKLNNPEAVYAYYVVLDEAYATESAPSEINAWKSYTYEGLNKVYKADEVAALKVASASANGDIIGFRVYVVNYDGTLVDPDGKSFYVYIGGETTSKLEFTQTITSFIASTSTTQSTDVVPFTPVSNVTSATLTMTIGHSKTLSLANLKLMKADNSTTANWSEVTKMQIIDVAPSDLNEGALYEGTLTLKNSSGVVINTTTITLKKVLPAKYVNTGITYKTSIHHNVNGYEVIYGYPNPDDYSYDLATALNFPTGFDLTKLKVLNKATYAGLTWNAGGTSGTVPNAAIGSANIYDLDLGYSYGYCKFDGNQYYAPWEATPVAIKVQFRSYVQDLADWKLTAAPGLIWGQDLTGYVLTNVTALPPAGTRVNMSNTGTLKNNATYTVTAVKLLTGASVANEYFIPTLKDSGADGFDTIDFAATEESKPSVAVDTKMVITVKDIKFNKEYTFEIPGTFPMTLH